MRKLLSLRISKMKRKVLKKAKLLTTRIPLKDTVLIIDEISKDISGTGMDANVPGILASRV